MTRKWGSAYQNRYEALVWRQKANKKSGNECEICGSEKDSLGRSNLIIEHIDNDSKNFSMENTRLAHPSCNQHKNPRGPQSALPKVEREITGQGYGEPDHTDPSAYVINKNADEDAVRQTVIEHLLRMGPDPDFKVLYALQLKNMINAVAEELDFSQATLYRYFGRMLNPINGFLSPRSKGKVTFLGFRHDEYYSLDPKEVMRMHPKRGQLFRQEDGGR